MVHKVKLRPARTRDSGGAVDEDEDHATEGPGDAEDADAAARRVGARRVDVRLVVVPDDGGHRDVEEEQRGDELGDHRAVQRPLGQLRRVDQRCRRRVRVVLGGELARPGARRLDVLLRHVTCSLSARSSASRIKPPLAMHLLACCCSCGVRSEIVEARYIWGTKERPVRRRGRARQLNDGWFSHPLSTLLVKDKNFWLEISWMNIINLPPTTD
jgi:hypothetical protein